VLLECWQLMSSIQECYNCYKRSNTQMVSV